MPIGKEKGNMTNSNDQDKINMRYQPSSPKPAPPVEIQPMMIAQNGHGMNCLPVKEVVLTTRHISSRTRRNDFHAGEAQGGGVIRPRPLKSAIWQ